MALPDLGRELSATTRDLQWIVDGYNLAFAALVLTAGSLGDRFGRRPALLVGLVGFAAGQRHRRGVPSAGALVAVRFVMGAFAALIFPTTLSIITNAFPDRGERAKAIGIWGAVTGLGVAVGPVTGGVLLAHFGWPSVFLALVPVALVALVATLRFVPESRDPAAGAPRPARPVAVLGRDRRAGLHDHRGARPRLDCDRSRSPASSSPPCSPWPSSLVERRRDPTRCSTWRCSARRPSRPRAARSRSPSSRCSASSSW